MKRILLLLCTLIVIPSHILGQDGVAPGPVSPQSWQRYTVKGEEFSVALPTLPSMITVKKYQTRLNKARRERQLQAAANGVIYIVDVFENPKPRQSLEEFIAEQNAKSVYELASERYLTISGFAGKEYSLRNKTPPATVQFFATEKRMYRFLASGSGAEDAGVKQFFSSIVLGKTDGIKVSDGPGLPLQSDVAEKTYTGKEVDVKARLLSKPEPTYTEKARAKEVVGTVVLKVIFSSGGNVVGIRVVSGLPSGLTEQAIKAAKKIKFIPAMKDGKYVSMWIQLEYNFNLY